MSHPEKVRARTHPSGVGGDDNMDPFGAPESSIFTYESCHKKLAYPLDFHFDTISSQSLHQVLDRITPKHVNKCIFPEDFTQRWLPYLMHHPHFRHITHVRGHAIWKIATQNINFAFIMDLR